MPAPPAHRTAHSTPTRSQPSLLHRPASSVHVRRAPRISPRPRPRAANRRAPARASICGQDTRYETAATRPPLSATADSDHDTEAPRRLAPPGHGACSLPFLPSRHCLPPWLHNRRCFPRAAPPVALRPFEFGSRTRRRAIHVPRRGPPTEERRMLHVAARRGQSGNCTRPRPFVRAPPRPRSPRHVLRR
ncbi:hypothetical protein DENSPDRAFT_563878 [Dentipellis sp. KUC8613]|nr:hypothetical protein DENSPDRAFT_563878 [Dentipellis sp. KUC8613]